MLVKKIQSCGASREELVLLWNTYRGSVLEYSVVVVLSSLTQENIVQLEITQRSFTKLVLKN